MKGKTFAGNYTSLALISAFVIEQAHLAGFSDQDVYDIQTAVDEASANIIDHAYGGENLGSIRIEFQEFSDRVHIVLKDCGKKFDPDEIPEPNMTNLMDGNNERGLGVYIIRKLMDQAIFDFTDPRGNTLTLIKLKKKPA